ncbi:MAG: hypothetical protein HY424_02625 [Candidatus Levybacteria bacterium]|nr:hypothetical protein [Candidatus Levybacteria bacterium]
MKYILEWIVEYVLIILHFPLTILNFFLPNAPVKESRLQIPIILVERWLKRNPLHFFMKKFLEKNGFTVYSINFPLLKGNFSESAKALKQFIQEKKLSNIILVGISCGGLTCYEYLTNYNGWEKTKKFISVGTPFQGAKLGFLLFFMNAGKELSPKGSYIQSLLKNPQVNSDKIYCLGAKYDELVGYKNSFILNTKQIVIDVAGHNFLHTLWIPTLEKIKNICLASR